MSLVLNVEILGEFRKLTEATNGASKQLSGLSSNASKISSNIGKAFGAIGIGLSFTMIARELEQATKAAVEDAKSQGLLATALKNTTGANKSQIASVEQSIAKMSIQAAVADDQLRPAFANLTRATGDVKKSTELMSLALDISAGTGKNLDTVVKALSRAVGPEGTTGALERLVPAIKGAADPMAELGKIFAGSAEEAANLDPYQRMNVALGEISESMGTILIPIVEAFAQLLVDILPTIQTFFENLKAALDSPIVQKAFKNLNDSLGHLGKSLGELFGITTGPDAQGFIQFFVVLTTILDGIVKAVDLAVQSFKNAMPVFRVFSSMVEAITRMIPNLPTQLPDLPTTGRMPGRTPVRTPVRTPAPAPGRGAPIQPPGNITIQVNNPNMTANDIVMALNKSRSRNGQVGLALQ